MTEFDAILQETLDATIKNMIVFVSVLIILGIVFAVGIIFVTKKLRTESMNNQDYERLGSQRESSFFNPLSGKISKIFRQ